MSVKRSLFEKWSMTLVLAAFIIQTGCGGKSRESGGNGGSNKPSPTPDTALTSTPEDLTNSDSAVFEFSCDLGGCKFECSLDGSAWSGCVSGQEFSNLSEGGHSFEVRAVKNGRRDKTPAGFTWTIDLTAPDTILINTPSDPTNSQDVDFEFACDSAPCTFKCQLDSSGWEDCASPKSYSGLADGSHLFGVRSIDAAGNIDQTPASFNWIIDTISPDTAITNRPSNPSNSTDAIFEFSCTESSCTFECQLDSGGWNSCESGVIYSSLSGGSHLFEVRAIDSAGNPDLTPANFAWSINPPPDTTITAHPPNPTNSGSASFSFDCDQPPCTFECNLDSAGWSTCSSPKNYGGVWTTTSAIGAPGARENHTAVWTGGEMIIWGGYNGFDLNTGAKYNPATDSWNATSTTNAPLGRHNQTAVWTGTEMIVWGGYNASYLNTGSRYNPTTDSWTSTSTNNVPAARENFTAVWTGALMIVWGGLGITGSLNTGGSYNPSEDSWAATTPTNAPTARDRHTAVWTGNEMIVWGTCSTDSSGGRYNPVTDSWAATSLNNAPTGRCNLISVWTGHEMVVWGGGGAAVNTGGRYNPTTNSWHSTATTGAPSARYYFSAVWTGTKMIVWGGTNGPSFYNTGGLYDPSSDSWT